MSSIPMIWIGYDPLEHEAYLVAKHSILRYCPDAIIKPLVNDTLRHIGLLRRAPQWTAEGGHAAMIDYADLRPYSTQFTFSRFLVPHLMARHGWAIFMDCDMMLRANIELLWDQRDDDYAIQCVKHDQKIEPGETKMLKNSQPQEPYTRKNWSAVMMINCAHPVHEKLSIDDVNTKSGRWLHQFGWIEDDSLIGALTEDWNWLDGYSDESIDPAIVHHTRGGPWFPEWQNVAFADEWRDNLARISDFDRERI